MLLRHAAAPLLIALLPPAPADDAAKIAIRLIDYAAAIDV